MAPVDRERIPRVTIRTRQGNRIDLGHMRCTARGMLLKEELRARRYAEVRDHKVAFLKHRREPSLLPCDLPVELRVGADLRRRAGRHPHALQPDASSVRRTSHVLDVSLREGGRGRHFICKAELPPRGREVVRRCDRRKGSKDEALRCCATPAQAQRRASHVGDRVVCLRSDGTRQELHGRHKQTVFHRREAVLCE